jgi:ribosome maturation factor RimP
MSALLDVKDVISSAYVLEVSSPGLDRPFKTDRDYERSIGRHVRVHYTGADGVSMQAAGTLAIVTDAEVRLDDHGRVTSIPRESIRRAHQDVQLPSHPRKKRGKR